MESSRTRERIRAQLRAAVGRRLGRPERDIDPGATFSALGLESSALVEVVATVAPELPPTVAWECVTINGLAERLSGRSPKELTGNGGQASDVAGGHWSRWDVFEPIAIVGMSCRFPGAGDLERFWQLLIEGRDAIAVLGEARRRDVLGGAGADAGLPGGYLDTVADFDPGFFGIAPREAIDVDPQQRLMLEVSWEALESAGIARARVHGSRTGVFLGCMWRDYAMRVASRPTLVGPHTAVGHDTSIVSARVSYFFGARGPSLTVNTACSSSLVATHLACRSLRERECDLALAGGVNLILTLDSTLAMQRFGGLSPDGRCHTFDARANGYARGEGAGVVVLKRYSDAVKAGDHVYAVIAGSAVNNDGASNGITAPNPAAQEEVLRSAYRRARVDLHQVQYVEAHGTGTLLGDPIEVRALAAVLGAGRDRDRPLAVGALKTNIGHLEGAAGVAGLIKTALALERGTIPPTVGIEEPNPNIPFEELKVQPVRSAVPWPESSARPTAGVSAFGFGGTNCHVVLQRRGPVQVHVWPAVEPSPEGIRDLATRTRRLMEDNPAWDLGTLCSRASAQLGSGTARAALTARSRQELADQLEALSRGEVKVTELAEVTEPGLIFAGQGSQEPGMGAELLQSEVVFRRKLEDCALIVDRLLGCSLIDEMLAPDSTHRLDDPRLGWPAVVSHEIALGALWLARGVRARGVIGHSIGEIAAAEWAGILSLEDALAVACAQGELIARFAGQGGMLLAEIAWDRAAEVEENVAGIHRAVHSSPGFTVFSGAVGGIEALQQWLRDRSVRHWRVRTNVAAHVPTLGSLAQELGDRIARIAPRPGHTPFVSTVEGRQIPGQELDAGYWVRSFHSPVLLAEAVSKAVETGTRLFLEVAPRELVARSAELTVAALGGSGTVLRSVPRGMAESEGPRRTLAELHSAGMSVDWRTLYPWGARPVEEGSSPSVDSEPLIVIPLSARDDDALRAVARDLAQEASGRPRWDSPTVADLGFSFANHRSEHDRRMAVVARTREELAQGAQMIVEGRPSPLLVRPADGPRSAAGGLVFVFSGQGSQWPAMARDLLAEEPAFRTVVERCEPIVRAHCGWSVADILAAGAPLDRTDLAQPALFVVQLGLVELWRSWGVRPDGVVGHSVGEVAAACCVGALDIESATRVVCERALAMADTPAGQMIAVDADAAAVDELLQGLPEGLSVAAVNGPRSVVVAGDLPTTAEAIARLAAAGRRHRVLRTGYPFHSTFLDPARQRLQQALATIVPAAADRAFYSTVEGTRTDAPLDGRYWGRNVRDTVRFWEAVQASMADGARTYVEIGPHPVLSGDIAAIAGPDTSPLITASMRRGEPAVETMRRALAKLWTNGLSCDWTKVYPAGSRRVTLPAYPWRRERYWRAVEGGPSDIVSTSRLGRETTVAVQPPLTVWQRQWSGKDLEPLMKDHKIGDEVLFPGAGYLSFALEVARRARRGPVALRGVRFRRALAFKEETTCEVQTVAGGDRVTVSSRAASTDAWELHAEAAIEPDAPEASAASIAPLAGAFDRQSSDDIYGALKERGYAYGPAYRLLRELRLAAEGAEAGLSPVFEPSLDEAGRETLALDAALQTFVVGAIAARGLALGTRLLPTGADRLYVERSLADASTIRVRLRGLGAGLVGDAELFGADGGLLGRIEGIHAADVVAAASPSLGRTVHGVAWRPVPLGPPPAHRPARWLIVSDGGGVGTVLARRLRERGDTVVRIRPGHGASGDDVQAVPSFDRRELAALLDRSFGAEPCQGVIFLSGLDTTEVAEGIEAAALVADQSARLSVLASMVLAVAEHGWRDLPRLWIATRGAQLFEAGGGSSGAMSQASLWGMAGSVSLEHPELACACIDLEPATAEDDARRICEELDAGGHEDRVAWRGGARLAARLEPLALATSAAPMLKDGRSYLITGGTGGLGLSLARWMLANGARELLLVSRRPPDADARAAVEDLRAAGARVEIAQADVSDLGALTGAVASAQRSGSPLGGVVHAAGILDDATLSRLTPEQIARVLAPKLAGGWNLHTLTRGQALDFFILFSSVTSWLGSPGQANYAAANAALDGLARYRMSRGLPGLSIAWGPFAHVGMAAASAGRGERLATRGLRSLDPDAAWDLLPRLVAERIPEVGAFSLDLRQWSEFYPAAAASAYLAGLADAGLAGEARPRKADESLRLRLLEHEPEERLAIVERALTELLGEVLNADPSRIDRLRAFGDLGLDSLLSLELRNRVEGIVGDKLSATLLFTYANLAALAAFVLQKLAGGAPLSSRSTAKAVHAQPVVPLDFNDVEAMSDAEAERLLADSLKQMEI